MFSIPLAADSYPEPSDHEEGPENLASHPSMEPIALESQQTQLLASKNQARETVK